MALVFMISSFYSFKLNIDQYTVRINFNKLNDVLILLEHDLDLDESIWMIIVHSKLNRTGFVGGSIF
ncbi:hypothetical protein Ahae2126ch_11215 [Acinetobacter haemolyticus]|nr:hypothetical protein Ahae2126ch_11215 [Acinetobacter haemolyticus]